MAAMIPLIIGGVLRLASPSVAKLLTKHGFKKATKNITQNKKNISKINSKQAKKLVDGKQKNKIDVDPKEFLKKYQESVKDGTQIINKKTLTDRQLDSLVKSAKEARIPPRHPHQRVGEKAFPNLKTKAKELTKDSKVQKFLESGPSKRLKKGGRIGKPKGVGIAKRGFGKAMKNGK